MSDEKHGDQSERKHTKDNTNTKLEKASDSHEVRNASGQDVGNAEKHRTNKFHSYSGEGERTPAVQPGMTREQAEKADKALNVDVFGIDYGDGQMMTSKGMVEKKADKTHLPFGTADEFDLLKLPPQVWDQLDQITNKKIIDGKFTPIKVKPGDNLWDLSQQHYGTPFLWPHLLSANRTDMAKAQGVDKAHVDPRKIYAGQTLYVPKPEK